MGSIFGKVEKDPVMERVHAEIDEERRKKYGLTISEVLDKQTPEERRAQMGNEYCQGQYKNRAHANYIEHMYEVNKRSQGIGVVKSFEDLRDTLIKKGFSEEDANRIAHEEMDDKIGNTSDDEFPDKDFKSYKLMIRNKIPDWRIRDAMINDQINHSIIDRFLEKYNHNNMA